MNTLALCIPAYNAEAYIHRLLQSASNQSIPFDEILVYDDASTDDTAKVAEKYGAKIIRGNTNKGCSFGKNVLAAKTNAKWVHFHDADDDILPDFTKLVMQWIKDHGDMYDVLLLNFQYIDHESGQILGQANYDVEELHRDPLRYAINKKIVNFGVYKLTSFLAAGGFDLDEKVLYNEDNALHQRLAKHGLKFDYLPEITCINYRYSVSMSASNLLKCARANFHVLANTAAVYGSNYSLELARELWKCSAILAAGQDWEYVRRALSLTKKLGYRYSPEGSTLFKVLTRVHPFFGLWIREKAVRLFKPHLRVNSL